MLPAEVCDGNEPPRSTSHRREFDLTRVLDAPMLRDGNGLDVTDAAYTINSSIGRLYEHRGMSAEVSDAHDLARLALYGREIDESS